MRDSRAAEVVELGSGSASKTRALLYAMAGEGTLRRYVPLDVSQATVESCAAELAELYPGLEVHGVVGDFDRDLERVPGGAAAAVRLPRRNDREPRSRTSARPSS